MDESVLRGMAKWPDVPAVYGWLSLDRRGNFLIKGQRIANAALREFMARNYAADVRGCWFFQNGPQRVYVKLAYTPLVIHHEDDVLVDHCGRVFNAEEKFIDEEGSLLLSGGGTVALMDDRDLARYAESAHLLRRIKRLQVEARFGFVSNPAP